MTATQPFRFLDLPPEIREKVYLEVLTSDEEYIPLTNEGLSPDELSIHSHFPSQLYLICNQIYQEIRPLYFALSSFSLLLIRNNAALSYFLSPTFLDNRRQIRKLRLTIERWGRNDFFLHTLAPILSDMILNGSLRDLEVRFRRSYFLEFGCAEETTKTLDQRCGPRPSFLNLRGLLALRAICEDPYLERVVLQTYMEPRRMSGTGVDEVGLEDVTYVLKRDRKGRKVHL